MVKNKKLNYYLLVKKVQGTDNDCDEQLQVITDYKVQTDKNNKNTKLARKLASLQEFEALISNANEGFLQNERDKSSRKKKQN